MVGQSPKNISPCRQPCDEFARHIRLIVFHWPACWQAPHLTHPGAVVRLAELLEANKRRRQQARGLRQPQIARRFVEQASNVLSEAELYHIGIHLSACWRTYPP